MGSYGFPDKAEDSVHVSGDSGLMALGVVNTAGVARASADGDYSVLSTTLEGFLRVTMEQGRAYAYAATTLVTTPVAATTDIAELRFVSKIIRVRKVFVFITATAGALATPTFLIKRGTAQDSGGTFTDPTVCPLDSANAAATAVFRRYTANPTLGTTVANISQAQLFPVNAPGSVPQPVAGRYCLYDAGNGQGIVLRATTESLVVNFGGTIPANTTPVVTVEMEWTEDQ